MTLPADAYKLHGLSPRAFEHPADRAATAALRQVPYLDDVVRRLIALGYENALRGAYLGSAVRLGQRQLPHVWVLHREVVNVLDLEPVPDLYLTQYPVTNALTIGSKRPIVVLHSETVRALDDTGLRVVLAHEAAHVLSDHVLYGTALQILAAIGAGVRLPVLAGLPLLAIRAALLEWSRAAELSCDRAAALVTRAPLAVCRTLMIMTAGAAADRLDLDAFMKQGLDYDEHASGFDRVSKLLFDMGLTHPLPVRRTHELLTWVRSGDYDRVVAGEYVRRGHEPGARDEAAGAAAHYAGRVQDAVQSVGQSVNDVGKALGDWLSRQGGGGA
ncbi:MAG TPA: M48 family metallopeptidase [Solirubrobacteraceae bacterium]|nr:M48 family metallopeptidase [Solirubrobacteraceae bacterium]